MENALVNRERLIDSVKVEIIGPSNIHEHAVAFKPQGNTELTTEEFRKNYYWLNCGLKEEVLQTDYPSRRYSTGMLYPIATKQEEVIDTIDLSNIDEDSEKIIVNNDLKEREISSSSAQENNVLQIRKVASNDHLPSSLGLTSRISNNTQKMKIQFTGAHYQAHKIRIKDKNYTKNWWLRESIIGEYELDFCKYTGDFRIDEPFKIYNHLKEEVSKFELSLNITCRMHGDAKLLTVTIINRSSSNKKARLNDELMIFQSEISLVMLDDTKFLKYPKNYERHLPLSQDELNDELLYRNKINYAFGHGCSTTWDTQITHIKEIKTTFLPTYETTSMTPDIEINVNGEKEQLSIRMMDLAEAKNFAEVKKILMPLIEGYEQWIQMQEKEYIPKLDSNLVQAAQTNMILCKESLIRMRRGLDHLQNPTNFRAFSLGNKAMLLQQVNGKEERTPVIDEIGVTFSKDISQTVRLLTDLKDSENAWRAFQIAFFLMSIDSIVNEESLEREIVDLIWFPTGGGKTEAYLAVAAFQMFYRRLIDPTDAGVDVLMRYTLRLLTADQFQRSSRLICAMEYLRKTEPVNLGSTPFSIGMWVGDNTSPNTSKKAISQLNEMGRGKRSESFLINRCPWCGSSLGQATIKSSKSRMKKMVLGFKNEGNRLVTYCPDKKCHFHSELPIYFVDDSIYEKRPTFMIGTVDKFVQLAWNPNSRALFGIDLDGNQIVSPPNLIVQDELHLISGPLGTLSGLFESVIEELCTKNINGRYIKPKIISATATIKEFQQQSKDLFAREKAKLFPSPGLDIDDSFFAKVAINKETQKPLPGRKYVGVFTSNVGLMMAEVQTFSAILQEANQMPKEECDPYWTLLAFYNSLRDLGAGINLCNMDIPTYMNAIRNREGYSENRFIREPLELTSRMQSLEISRTIDNLKKEFDLTSKYKPLDVCLASNIIEVGVDIDRLSVMAVVGQPKMTAQYIQVTGRVGRRWYERPGVIFTIYSNRNSRDKSHFEHFNEYHQRLYAQVETTSVTPFSDASLERGLSAVVIAFIRQRFSKLLANTPDAEAFSKIRGEETYQHFKNGLEQRVMLIDPEQGKSFKQYYSDIEKHILSGDFTTWKVADGVQGLMFMSGDPIAQRNNPNAIGVINSLRSVDAESKGRISHLFHNLDQVQQILSTEPTEECLLGEFE